MTKYRLNMCTGLFTNGEQTHVPHTVQQTPYAGFVGPQCGVYWTQIYSVYAQFKSMYRAQKRVCDVTQLIVACRLISQQAR